MNFIKISLLAFGIVLVVISCKQQNQEMTTVDDMNQCLETILARTSVREYNTKEITTEEIGKLLRAGMAAPSSRDRRPWHFIVVSDKSMLQHLGEQLVTASALKNANKAILVCGDIEISDNCWFLDGAAATQNILLAATSLGIGSVWAAIFPYEDRSKIISDVFQLPENIKALAIIPLGYPAGKNTPKDKFDSTRIHYDKW